MVTLLRCLVGITVATLLACGTFSAASPKVPPEVTVTSTTAEQTSLRTAEGKSVIQSVVAEVALGSNREEIVEFTRGALAIEADRNAGIEFYALLLKKYGSIGATSYMNKAFVEGFLEHHLKRGAPEQFKGMHMLQRRLLLLDVPQVLEPIKDSLVQAYEREIQLAIQQSQTWVIESKFSDGLREPKVIMPQVTKDNVDDTQASLKPWRRLGLWGETQLFRKEIYNRWSEILEEQGIDPADGGLTELVFDR